MEQVNVKRLELLEIVKKNLKKHREEYITACKDFKKAGQIALQKKLAQFKTGRTKDFSIHLVAPVNHFDEYMTAIRMLELSCNQAIQLQEHEFMRLVMDKWEWKHEFMTNNMEYRRFLSKK